MSYEDDDEYDGYGYNYYCDDGYGYPDPEERARWGKQVTKEALRNKYIVIGFFVGCAVTTLGWLLS